MHKAKSKVAVHLLAWLHGVHFSAPFQVVCNDFRASVSQAHLK